MPTVPLPHVALQPAGAAAVGRTGRTGRVVGTRSFCCTCAARRGTGCVCHRLQNATVIRRLVDTCVFVCALGQRLLASHPPTLILAAAEPGTEHQRIAAEELFTDALTRHWSPLQSIRLGWRWTLWMPQEQTQYPSFAGARQVAGVAAGQGGLAGLFVAMPPPPWLAWWR